MEELSYLLTKDFVSWVHVSFYFFTSAHFPLAVPYEMFKFFFQRNSSPLFSITRSSSLSVIHASVNIKNNVEKDTTLLFFSLSKSLGDLSCIWVAIPANWVILYWCACGANGHVTTEISQMHRLPNFLTYGAPLRALRAGESSAIILMNTQGDKNRLHELHSYGVKVQQLLTITSETRAPIKRPCSFPFDIRICFLVACSEWRKWAKDVKCACVSFFKISL